MKLAVKKKPILEITDRNMVAILGKAAEIGRSKGWSSEMVELFLQEAMSKDVQNAWDIIIKYFEVRIKE